MIRSSEVTFDCEGFPDSQGFTVCVDGDFVVQQSFVHDEGVQSLRVSPGTENQDADRF